MTCLYSLNRPLNTKSCPCFTVLCEGEDRGRVTMIAEFFTQYNRIDKQIIAIDRAAPNMLKDLSKITAGYRQREAVTDN